MHGQECPPAHHRHPYPTTPCVSLRQDFAETMGTREQLAIAEFAQALLVIPRTLAVNGAFDATELIAQLRSCHHLAQHSADPAQVALKYTGLDLQAGKIRNSIDAGVMEPAMSKLKSIRFATEAAVTILRIDDAIKMAPKEAPQDRDGHGH